MKLETLVKQMKGKAENTLCSVAGCVSPIQSGKGGQVGPPALCPKHYQRERRGSKVTRDRAPPGEATSFTLRCSTDELGRWERAARKAKQGFRDWVRGLLDGAA